MEWKLWFSCGSEVVLRCGLDAESGRPQQRQVAKVCVWILLIISVQVDNMLSIQKIVR